MAHFGQPAPSIDYVFRQYCDGIAGAPSPSHLLWSCNWAKQYSSEDTLFSRWDVSKPTYRKYVRSTFEYLATHMDEIHWEDRLDDPVPSRTSIFNPCRTAFDCTESPVARPAAEPFQHWYYSGKKGRHTIIYAVAVRLIDGHIVHCPSWLALPGSQHDMTMMARGMFEGLMEEWEWALVDKGLIGMKKGLHPVKGAYHSLTWEQRYYNAGIQSARVIVEHSIGEIKAWDCLKIPFRHDLRLHPVIFHVAANFANVNMTYLPIQRHPNPWLC